MTSIRFRMATLLVCFMGSFAASAGPIQVFLRNRQTGLESQPNPNGYASGDPIVIYL